MEDLTSMKNIGKEMKKKLESVGISTPSELREIGSKDTFFRLKIKYPEVCLVHLYTIEGAIQDKEYNNLSEETKRDLESFSNSLK